MPIDKGKRARISKSDAHNPHERLFKHEDSVLRFLSDPNVSFTNNAGKQKIRKSKVNIKVSGYFRTELYAKHLVPDIELSRFHGSTRIQSTRIIHKEFRELIIICDLVYLIS